MRLGFRHRLRADQNGQEIIRFQHTRKQKASGTCPHFRGCRCLMFYGLEFVVPRTRPCHPGQQGRVTEGDKDESPRVTRASHPGQQERVTRDNKNGSRKDRKQHSSIPTGIPVRILMPLPQNMPMPPDILVARVMSLLQGKVQAHRLPYQGTSRNRNISSALPPLHWQMSL